jgi:hypothetical protein
LRVVPLLSLSQTRRHSHHNPQEGTVAPQRIRFFLGFFNLKFRFLVR